MGTDSWPLAGTGVMPLVATIDALNGGDQRPRRDKIARTADDGD
jgi:hypothetical protein